MTSGYTEVERKTRKQTNTYILFYRNDYNYVNSKSTFVTMYNGTLVNVLLPISNNNLQNR